MTMNQWYDLKEYFSMSDEEKVEQVQTFLTGLDREDLDKVKASLASEIKSLWNQNDDGFMSSASFDYEMMNLNDLEDLVDKAIKALI